MLAWQVEKSKALVPREIVWRLDEDLDRRFSCVHFDGDFGIPEIDLVAASVSPPENSIMFAPAWQNSTLLAVRALTRAHSARRVVKVDLPYRDKGT